MPRPTPPDDDHDIAEAIAAGIAAVEEAAWEAIAAGAAVTCRDIGRVFDTAIEHGAPIWNRGSQLGCATIYRHVARSLLAGLRPPAAPHPACSPSVGGALDALAQAANDYPAATSANANPLGWALRAIFDRFHVSRGMEDVNLLITAAKARGTPDADLVNLCLTVAIGHGNVLYQAEALDACALLHTYTARRVLDLVARAELDGPLSTGLRRTRAALAPILSRAPEVTRANGKQVAWELYEAFQSILGASDPRPTPRAEASEYHGFISYRRDRGSDAAFAIRASLQVRGLNTFVDVEGLDSGAYGPRLLRAIERAPNFLLLLTPGALDRCPMPGDWLRQEIAHAIQTGRCVIPVLKDGFQFGSAPPLPPDIAAVTRYQAVTYSHEYFGAVIDRLEQYMRTGIRDLGFSDD